MEREGRKYQPRWQKRGDKEEREKNKESIRQKLWQATAPGNYVEYISNSEKNLKKNAMETLSSY